MNYNKVYISLILNRQANPLDENAYGERHHIVPRAEGGSDDESNLVRLSAREHYIAHLLLAKIYDDYKMYSALVYMRCGNKFVNRNFKFNSRLYEKMRKEFAKKFSEFISGENHPNYGKHLSKETCERISKANTGKRRSQEQKNKISEATKKALTPEVIAKFSASLKGRKVWNKGLHGYSTAKKGTHLSDDTKAKISKSITGTKWWNNGVVERQSKECPLGFVAGRLKISDIKKAQYANMTADQRRKMTECMAKAIRGKKYWHKGDECVLSKKCPGEGWTLGQSQQRVDCNKLAQLKAAIKKYIIKLWHLVVCCA